MPDNSTTANIKTMESMAKKIATEALEKALKDARKLGSTTSNSSSRDDGGDEGPCSAELADAIAQKIIAALLLQSEQIGASGYKFTATAIIVVKPAFGLSMSSAAAWNGEIDLMFTIKEESLLVGHVIIVTVFALAAAASR